MLAALGKAKYFTALDLKSGYWQIPVNEGNKEKMAFTCHRDLCEYSVMHFSLVNALGIFRDILMSTVLHGLANFTMAYLGDIIVLSTSKEEHENIFNIL